MSAFNFHVITALWGDEFIALFLTTAVPNQLSTGNLSSLPPGSRYRIFTTAADRERLERAEAVRAVNAVLPVDIVVMDPDQDTDANRYSQMISYNRRAVEDALRCGAALIFLAPDHVLATHTMARLVELRAKGYRAVVTLGIRLSKEPMLAALAEYRVTDLPPRALVRLAMDHLHPVTVAYLEADAPRLRFPTFAFWRTENGLLARSLHMHSLMLDPVRPELPNTAPDGRYLAKCVPDLKMVYVVTDSDDLVYFELTTIHNMRKVGGRISWSQVWRMASIAFRCDAHQIAFWQRPIRFHWNDLGAAWAPVEIESARFADAVLNRRLPARWLFPAMNGIRRWQQRHDRRVREWRRRLPRIRLKQVTRPIVIALHHAKKRLRRALR